MHDIQSAITSVGLGLFTYLFSQDMTTYAAFFGLVLVVVRIFGDLPKAIGNWRDLLKGVSNDSQED